MTDWLGLWIVCKMPWHLLLAMLFLCPPQPNHHPAICNPKEKSPHLGEDFLLDGGGGGEDGLLVNFTVSRIQGWQLVKKTTKEVGFLQVTMRSLFIVAPEPLSYIYQASHVLALDRKWILELFASSLSIPEDGGERENSFFLAYYIPFTKQPVLVSRKVTCPLPISIHLDHHSIQQPMINTNWSIIIPW